MDRSTIAIDPSATKLRRVGRLARRRMRIEGDQLVNGIHTDGTLTVAISGLGSPVAGVPDAFEWEADRPIALVIVRSGIDGEDVAFEVGPRRSGLGRGAAVGDGTGIRYVAFCYDAAPSATAAVPVVAPAPIAQPTPVDVPAAAAVMAESPVRRGIAAARSLNPVRRDRRSILAQMLLPRTTGRAST